MRCTCYGHTTHDATCPVFDRDKYYRQLAAEYDEMKCEDCNAQLEPGIIYPERRNGIYARLCYSCYVAQ